MLIGYMRTDKHFKRYFSAPLPDDVVPCGRSAGDSRIRKDGFLWRAKTIVVAGFLESTGDVSGPSPWSTHAMERGKADHHGLGPKQSTRKRGRRQHPYVPRPWRYRQALRAEAMHALSAQQKHDTALRA